jgi:hypothetical protein
MGTYFLMKVRITRLQRVLTIVYNTRNYWVFGLCPSSGVPEDWRTQCFGNWICLGPQVRKGDTCSIGSLIKS